MYCMQCLDNTLPSPPLALPRHFPASQFLADANAHAFNRQVLKLIHSKPAALRVVYYKRVFIELSPLMRRARRLLQSFSKPTFSASLSNRNTRGNHLCNCHHGMSQIFLWCPRWQFAVSTRGPRAVLMLIVNSFNPVSKMHKNMKQTS